MWTPNLRPFTKEEDSMRDNRECSIIIRSSLQTIPVHEAIGKVLAHDITEIRQNEFKGSAFRKGHVVREEDISHLQRLGKERLYVLSIGDDEIHEDEAAVKIATALSGEGIAFEGEPKEGKINLIAQYDGILKVDHERLVQFNMLGDVMCATIHTNSIVKRGQVVAGTRAIPLLVKKDTIDKAVDIARPAGQTRGVIEVKSFGKPRAGVVITGNEVYYGRIKDAFAPIIRAKIEALGGEIVGLYYAPDDQLQIRARLEELLQAGADILITTGGMSVDPDDVTRFAIRDLGATHITYGSAVLPGAMFLVAYLNKKTEYTTKATPIPILGIPACGMYHKRTVFDLIFPRVLAGEFIGRRELAELGHGGLCLNCKECHYPICPFGK